MLKNVSLLVLAAGVALSIDLETVQRSAHFPAKGGVHLSGGDVGPRVRPSSADFGDEERLYYQLLSSRMGNLLPSLLGEGELGQDSDGTDEDEREDDDVRSGLPEQEADEVMMYLPKRRVVHPLQSYSDMDSFPIYGIRKRMPMLKKRLGGQGSRDEKRKRSTRRYRENKIPKKSSSRASRKKQFASQNKDKKAMFRAVQRHEQELQKQNGTHKAVDPKMKPQSAKKYKIMKRSSQSSTDEKVIGELRSIFSDDDKEDQKKTVKKREDATAPLKSGESDADALKPESDEDKFKKWLLDEYYRTMALSFASMRKKRMATHQDTLDLRKVKKSDAEADDQFQAVEARLRGIEDTMIGEALELVRDGAGDESELRAINAGVASRVDAAYDLENVRRSLDHLQSTLSTMHRREGDDDQGGRSSDDIDAGSQGSWAQIMDKHGQMSIPVMKRQEEQVPQGPDCSPLQVLSSGCTSLEDLMAFDTSLETEVLAACNWHQVCYTCGSFFGLTSEDCDEGIGVDNPQLARLVLNYLLRRQTFFRRSTPALCSAPCVADFLLNR